MFLVFRVDLLFSKLEKKFKKEKIALKTSNSVLPYRICQKKNKHIEKSAYYECAYYELAQYLICGISYTVHHIY